MKIKILRTDRADLSNMVARLGLRGKMDLEPVIQATTAIIAQVRQQGDAALLELTARFDKVLLRADQLRVSEQEISLALDKVDLTLIDVLRRSADNIRRFHLAQLPADTELEDLAAAVRISLVNRALDIGRRLCAGRHGAAAVISPDEHYPGQSRWRA